MYVFSERLPIKSFKQDITALREFARGKEHVIVTSLLAPGTCNELSNIGYQQDLYGQKLMSLPWDGEGGVIVVNRNEIEQMCIARHVKEIIQEITLKGVWPKRKYNYTEKQVDALLIAIGQAGSKPIVKLLMDAYCLHRFYSGEKEI